MQEAWDGGERDVKRLADAADTSPQTVYVILGQLRKAGLIEGGSMRRRVAAAAEGKPDGAGHSPWRVAANDWSAQDELLTELWNRREGADLIAQELSRMGATRTASQVYARAKALKLKPRPRGNPTWRTRWTPPQDAPAVVTTRIDEQGRTVTVCPPRWANGVRRRATSAAAPERATGTVYRGARSARHSPKRLQPPFVQ